MIPPLTFQDMACASQLTFYWALFFIPGGGYSQISLGPSYDQIMKEVFITYISLFKMINSLAQLLIE
jgi:hypothetical protein